ncbi:MAG: thioredoxin-disulfide reductase [Lachnospiraceae bacterium]|nr:thioredoxin-disulfide reductase [Lachnospiraceae bacterium]
MELYDIAIIGSGPAGLSAAVYALRAELKTVVFERDSMSGGQVLNTDEVDNYLGLPGINGFDLGTKFREHAEQTGMQTISAQVMRIEEQEGIWTVVTDEGEYKTKTVLLATGTRHRKLEIPGEERLSGKGVSYCATCDGAFFRNKEVAVIGGGDVAVEDALYLSRLCKKVYVVHRREEFRAAPSLVRRMKETENIELILKFVPEEIFGEGVVEGLTIKEREEEKRMTLAVSGVFVAIGTVPESEIYKEIVPMDEAGYVLAGEDGKTQIPGIFAAGDIRTKKFRQIVTAVADGANAVHSIEEYLIKGR